MKKRNRILSVLLCAAMVAGLAGCGSKNDSEDSGEKDGKIKLTFSTDATTGTLLLSLILLTPLKYMI